MKAKQLLEQACANIAKALETSEIKASDEYTHNLLVAAKRLLESAMATLPKS